MNSDQNDQHKKECKHLSCCLKTEPTPLSENFQKMRKNMEKMSFDKIKIEEGQKITFTEDMIVGDIIEIFPHTKPYFEDVNPLGLQSKSIEHESIAIFLAGTGIDVKNFCLVLNSSF